ncbi:MAG: hypothetical protein AAGC55_04410 [Myxococcota bacterium]
MTAILSIPSMKAVRALASTAALALLLPAAGCALDSMPTESNLDEFVGAEGNWADQDTNGVGTHRLTGDFVNVRSDELETVLFVARIETQVALTYRTQEFNDLTYYEAFFKTGEFAGERGWVAQDFLAHTVLSVCRGSGINVRKGDQLQDVIGTVNSGDRAFVVSGTIRNTGSHRYFEVSAGGLQGFVATDYLCGGGGADGNWAQAILGSHDARLMTLSNDNFGRGDGADPLQNIIDAAAGLGARRSCDGGAPCGRTPLNEEMLEGMARMASDYNFNYFVTSIAGAVHSSNSLHYAGRAVDIGIINGQVVSGDTSLTRAIMQACRDLGADEVLGPNNEPVFHSNHIHCGWRP